MEKKELKEILEKSNNKLEILTDIEILKQYKYSTHDLYDLIANFLNDEEKLKLFDYSYFRQLDTLRKRRIIELISDEDILLKVLMKDNLLSDFKNYDIIKLVKKMDDTGKEKLLQTKEILEKYKFNTFEICNIIDSMNSQAKYKILSNKRLIHDTLNIKDYYIAQLVENLENEEYKNNLVDSYQFDTYIMTEIVKTFKDSSKEKILLESLNNNTNSFFINIFFKLNTLISTVISLLVPQIFKFLK